MKTKYLLLLALFLPFLTGCQSLERWSEKKQGAANVEKLWGRPYTLWVRATNFGKGKEATDKWSRKCQSCTGLPLRYTSESPFGVCAGPSSLRHGSIVIRDEKLYIKANRGSAVESRKAAWKGKKKTEAERNAIVIDFCEPRQDWPDYIAVTVYPYIGNEDFDIKMPLARKMLICDAARARLAESEKSAARMALR